MRTYCAALVIVLTLPTTSFSTTAPDLRSRIVVDGVVADFTADEWILDEFTSFPEPPGDSRWGTDNDIRAIALTWDNFNLYTAVSAVTRTTRLMLFIDIACGGVSDLNSAFIFRRNVHFGRVTPNFLLQVSRNEPNPRVGLVDCNTPLNIIDTDQLSSAYLQDGVQDGALEIAVPWSLLGDFEADSTGTLTPQPGQTLSVLALVTGGAGTGAGDAGPDPSVRLEVDSLQLAIINNFITLPLDANGDGVLDVGVSPRAAATYALSQTTDQPALLPLELVVQDKLIAPDMGEMLVFRAALNPPDYDLPVFLTARIYSVDGRLARNLFDDVPRDLSATAPPVWDSWDGTDNEGNTVPGGIFILALSAGPAADGPKNTVKASFAVIR